MKYQVLSFPGYLGEPKCTNSKIKAYFMAYWLYLTTNKEVRIVGDNGNHKVL